MFKKLTPEDKEEKVKANLREHCKMHQALYQHNAASIYTNPGIVDYTILNKNGITIYCECKRPKGKLNPAQDKYKKNILKNLGIHLLYDGLNDDELIKLLELTKE